jgi:hypothetical protein
MLPFVIIAIAIVGIGLVSRGGRGDGPPLDPRSTGPFGTRGLVLLLEHFGADVRLSTGVPDGGGTAVLLTDSLNQRRTSELRHWAEAGGTLVVADPFSDLVPAIQDRSASIIDLEAPSNGDLRPQCSLPALQTIRRIEVPGAAPYRVPSGAVGCFPVDGGSFLVAEPMGSGTLIALGGGGPFINRQLDQADNAALAVALMVPNRGTAVTILVPGGAGSGDSGLLDLVSRRVKDGLWQALIAFGIFAAWRARRLGRPIAEPQPVQIAGSELVVAVGNLLQQARRRGEAAGMLRAELRRTLAERLGLPADAPADVVAEAAADRVPVERERLHRALAPTPPMSDDELVALAQSIANLRNEVTHAR